METQNKTRTIDWQACERDFRAGVMSLREMAAAHGVSHVSIKKRADKEGWTRDLKAKIQAKADELVNRALVNAELTEASGVNERVIIAANSDRIAKVRLEHRQDISRMRSLCQALLAELETQTFDVVVLAQLGELMRSPDDSGMDKLNDIYKKVISTPGRVDTAKKLVETMKSVIAMEREAYNIGTSPAEELGNGVAAFLSGLKRSALPVVAQVEADDDY
jgi:hypothetical protein